MRWPAMAAVLLGGVTWVSSSGIVARLLTELGASIIPRRRPS
jgi:Kef-type K+ transport system membrane component KefB